MNSTKKRTIRNPEKWIGKRINTVKWNIPCGYEICRQTGKLYPESQLLSSFNHHLFERPWLRANGIFVEDADWLSDDGYDEIVSVLEKAGVWDQYIEGEYIGKVA
jgi:hypothetical protein